jgi:hypothetical protein
MEGQKDKNSYTFSAWEAAISVVMGRMPNN